MEALEDICLVATVHAVIHGFCSRHRAPRVFYTNEYVGIGAKTRPLIAVFAKTVLIDPT